MGTSNSKEPARIRAVAFPPSASIGYSSVHQSLRGPASQRNYPPAIDRYGNIRQPSQATPHANQAVPGSTNLRTPAPAHSQLPTTAPQQPVLQAKQPASGSLLSPVPSQLPKAATQQQPVAQTNQAASGSRLPANTSSSPFPSQVPKAATQQAASQTNQTAPRALVTPIPPKLLTPTLQANRTASGSRLSAILASPQPSQVLEAVTPRSQANPASPGSVLIPAPPQVPNAVTQQPALQTDQVAAGFVLVPGPPRVPKAVTQQPASQASQQAFDPWLPATPASRVSTQLFKESTQQPALQTGQATPGAPVPSQVPKTASQQPASQANPTASGSRLPATLASPILSQLPNEVTKQQTVSQAVQAAPGPLLIPVSSHAPRTDSQQPALQATQASPGSLPIPVPSHVPKAVTQQPASQASHAGSGPGVEHWSTTSVQVQNASTQQASSSLTSSQPSNTGIALSAGPAAPKHSVGNGTTASIRTFAADRTKSKAVKNVKSKGIPATALKSESTKSIDNTGTRFIDRDGISRRLLYVDGLSKDVTVDVLTNAFSINGHVVNAVICRDPVSGRSLGYGYVDFARGEDGVSACSNMQDAVICNHPIRVLYSARANCSNKHAAATAFVRIDKRDSHDIVPFFKAYGRVLSVDVNQADSSSPTDGPFDVIVHYEHATGPVNAAIKLAHYTGCDTRIEVRRYCDSVKSSFLPKPADDSPHSSASDLPLTTVPSAAGINAATIPAAREASEPAHHVATGTFSDTNERHHAVPEKGNGQRPSTFITQTNLLRAVPQASQPASGSLIIPVTCQVPKVVTQQPAPQASQAESGSRQFANLSIPASSDVPKTAIAHQMIGFTQEAEYPHPTHETNLKASARSSLTPSRLSNTGIGAAVETAPHSGPVGNAGDSASTTSALKTYHGTLSIDRDGISRRLLYVDGLSKDVTVDVVTNAFCINGHVVNAVICRDPVSGLSLGYGYVDFSQEEDGVSACSNMQDAVICNHPIRVLYSARADCLDKHAAATAFVRFHKRDRHDIIAFFGSYGRVLCVDVDESPLALPINGLFDVIVHYETIGSMNAAVRLAHNTGCDTRIEVRRYCDSVKSSFLPMPADDSLHSSASDLTLPPTLSPVVVNVATKSAALETSKPAHHVATRTFSNSNQRRHVVPAKNTVQRLNVPATKLFVGGFGIDMDEMQLWKLFEPFGEIISAEIVRYENGASRGYAFVRFREPTDAQTAITELNGKLVGVNKRRLHVDRAKTREEKERGAWYTAQASLNQGSNSVNAGSHARSSTNNTGQLDKSQKSSHQPPAPVIATKVTKEETEREASSSAKTSTNQLPNPNKPGYQAPESTVSSVDQVELNQKLSVQPAAASANKVTTDRDKKGLLCAVCFDQPVEVILRPCNHISFCKDCTRGIKECHMCRKPVESVETVFINGAFA